MKITEEDYAELCADIKKYVVARFGIDEVLQHKKKELGDDKAMRFRWDLFWRIPQERRNALVSKLYEYAHDEHLDTALKRVVRELEGLHPELKS